MSPISAVLSARQASTGTLPIACSIATARELGVPLVTRDRRILDYAEQGHVDAIAC